MKFILNLILVITFTCDTVYYSGLVPIERCENDEVICYINKFKGGMFCSFKEQKSNSQTNKNDTQNNLRTTDE